MRKTISSITVLTLTLTLFYSPFSTVLANEKGKNLKIETKGHTKSIVVETTDYDPRTEEETIVETYGENLVGKFHVDTESFDAKIKNEETKESFDLEGKIERVLEEDKAYVYKGVDKENDLIKFEAFVEKGSGKEYNASINIYEYDKKNDEEISSKTYIFDGKGKESKKYKQKANRHTIKMKKVKGKDGRQKLKALYEEDEDEYYKRIQAGTGKGYRYRIQGPLTTETDAGSNHSFRWGTDRSDIRDILEEDGYDMDLVTWTDVVRFRLRIYTDEPIVFNTVDPINDRDEEFEVPMYFGQTIGVVNIPVEVSSLDIEGSGTDDLLYDFKWSESIHPSGYLDERDFDKDPDDIPGFAVRYFMDTAPTVDTGEAKINFNGYFKYRSAYNRYLYFQYVFTEITRKSYYDIEIVD